ncbi:MAG: hypothetical protein IJY69_02085 [Clostridia bacterium]|nr:hypothetical protein [Clostridia bacterium]
MKKQITLITMLLAIMSLICSCAQSWDSDEGSLWDNATYSESTSLGEGATTFTVKVVAEDKEITLTLRTDETVLGTALHNLGITNDPSFFDTVNGMVAKWDPDQAYWAFYIGDSYATVGVDDVTVDPTADYRLVYTK